VCIASRDPNALQKAADTIARETSARVHAVAADLSKAEAIADWHAQPSSNSAVLTRCSQTPVALRPAVR
jgi:short-subunit dehydrogenase